MKNQFVSYEQSLALKQLGFDEPCFGYYDNMRSFAKNYVSSFIQQQGEPFTVKRNSEIQQLKGYTICTAPLKQQVFRWFRENNMLLSLIFQEENMFFWYEIENGIYQECTSKEFDSYEEAESECINKLIEIVKNK